MKPTIYCLIYTILLAGCNRYYMPVVTKDPKLGSIKKYIGENRQLMLRVSSAVYEMSNVRLDENSNEIHGELQKISGLHSVPGTRGKHYYYKPSRPDSLVSKQVHLLVNRITFNESDANVVVPVSSISAIEELKFDKRKTKQHKLAIGLGIPVGAAAVAGLIAGVLHEFSDWGN